MFLHGKNVWRRYATTNTFHNIDVVDYTLMQYRVACYILCSAAARLVIIFLPSGLLFCPSRSLSLFLLQINWPPTWCTKLRAKVRNEGARFFRFLFYPSTCLVYVKRNQNFKFYKCKPGIVDKWRNWAICKPNTVISSRSKNSSYFNCWCSTQ